MPAPPIPTEPPPKATDTGVTHRPPLTTAPTAGQPGRHVVVLELFAGAGGGSHALRLLGVPDTAVTTIFVESGDSHPNAWLHRCLRKSFPGATILQDVNDLLADDARLLRDLAKAQPDALFVVMGGFPCQDLSSANPRASGFKGARSILAAVMATIIRRLQDLVGTCLARTLVPSLHALEHSHLQPLLWFPFSSVSFHYPFALLILS